jgi:hypothetical protein
MWKCVGEVASEEKMNPAASVATSTTVVVPVMFSEPFVPVPSVSSSVRPKKYCRAVSAVGMTKPISPKMRPPVGTPATESHGSLPRATSSISASTSSVLPATQPRCPTGVGPADALIAAA